MNRSSLTPIHLDTLAVIEAARAAHAYGLLTAQAPFKENRRCKYEDEGRVCAIGAELPPELAHFRSTIDLLISRGVVGGSAYKLQIIQDAHDAWATAQNPSERRYTEAAFLRTLSEVGGRHG